MDFSGMPQNFPPDHQIPGEARGPDGMMDPSIQQQYGPDMYTPEEQHEAGEYSAVHSLQVDGGHSYGVSSVCFDSQQELLWMGNQGGHVTSYYGLDLQKYTSFQVHASDDIRQIITLDQGILALTSNKLRCQIRRGLPVFDYSGNAMLNMQCMMATSPTSVLLGGHQTKVTELDLTKGQEIRQVDVNEPGCAIFRNSQKYICAGDTSGKVTLFDPKSLKAEHVLEAHTGTLSDFDVHGNLLVTCGFSSRMGNMQIDHCLMVYDMRVMRSVAPIQVVIDPMYLRFVPTYSNRLAVVSQNGTFQLIETTAITQPGMMLYQMNTQGGVVMAFDVSSTTQAMAFGDSHGYLHLFANSDHATFNQFSEPTAFADPVEHLDPIHITYDLASLGTIPTIYPTTGRLLSEMPPAMCQRVYRKPKDIDKEILRSMKVYPNSVGYAPNPGRGKRNQIPYRMATAQKSKTRKSNVPESPLGRGDDPFVEVPKRYSKVEIKYSKLGVEDFDFRHYNKTNFAGLETHIPNAYCNAMLQMLYFIEPLRCNLLSHICWKEFCLSCELGFLFHMLDKQKGQTCQATNFLRAFRTIPEAAALGLVLNDTEESTGKVNFPRLIQSWQRFVHQQVHSDLCAGRSEEGKKSATTGAVAAGDKEKGLSEPEPKETGEKTDGEGAIGKEYAESSEDSYVKKEETSIITDLFGSLIETTLTCRCGQATKRETNTTLINLQYPDCNPQGHGRPPIPVSFSDVLKMSLSSEQTLQAYCNVCERFQPHNQTKFIKSLPDVVALNCQLEHPRELEFWRTQLELLKPKDEDGQPLPPPPAMPTTTVRCRYGNGCTRKDCKFLHDRDIIDPAMFDMSRMGIDYHDPTWVPLGLKLTLKDTGDVDILEMLDDDPMPKEEDPKSKFYEMLGVVCHIKDVKTGGNLVGLINVGEKYHQRKENVTCTQWYLLNDFSITPIEKYEAVEFNFDWKIPSVIYYIRRNITKNYDLKVTNPIKKDILLNDVFLVNPERRVVTFSPVGEDDQFKDREIIGLDAEFVSLDQEEAELKSDGTRSTIKPSHMSVARITCIRGPGPKQGEPFLDDYISTQEQVVDYLTQYSGIKPGDLDPTISRKHLTSLKATYVKLRYLVDSGVVFVGHGLKKDFRVINILVPKDHVIDTVDLFHQPRQRMISLKFLAWYFLKINIQSCTHDSVEDARTAMQLYLKYQEMSQSGMDTVRNTIKEMYEFGRSVQWKIPDVDDDLDDNQIAYL